MSPHDPHTPEDTMADVLVIEFIHPDGKAVDLYYAVNEQLGFDPVSGSGDLPEGMLSHTAGESDDRLIVIEVWESQAHQQAFMDSQLGPAFHSVGAPQPTRIEWYGHAGSSAA
jgi:hypothetical protein